MADSYPSDKRAVILWVSGILASIATAGCCGILGLVIGLNSRVAVLESQSVTFRDSINQMSGKIDALLLQSNHK